MNLRGFGAVVLAAGALSGAACDRSSVAAEAASPGGAPAVGTVCEVVFRPGAVRDHDRPITPRHTRENVNGSADSAFGRFVAMTDDWVVLETSHIRGEEKDGKFTTFGAAGEHDPFEFWIPKRNILYMRARREGADRGEQ